MQADPSQLDAAATVTEQVIAAIGEDQWDLPTPCSDWNVDALVRHVVAGNHGLAVALDPAAGPKTPAAAETSADLADAYRQSVRAVIDAFGARDRTARLVPR